jgi:hypothetical protein
MMQDKHIKYGRNDKRAQLITGLYDCRTKKGVKVRLSDRMFILLDKRHHYVRESELTEVAGGINRKSRTRRAQGSHRRCSHRSPGRRDIHRSLGWRKIFQSGQNLSTCHC